MASVLRFDEWQDSDGNAVASGAGGVFTSPGSILQVVSTTKTDTFSTTSTSFTDITGLSASITPRSTSSKILAFGSITSSADADRLVAFRLMRDATPIGVGDAAGSRDQSTSYWYFSFANDYQAMSDNSFQHLDSPSTTSTVTYGIEAKTNAGTLYVNRTAIDTDSSIFSRTVSNITLMEVAG